MLLAQDYILNYFLEMSSFIGMLFIIYHTRKIFKHKKYYRDYVLTFIVFLFFALTFLLYAFSQKHYLLVVVNLSTQIICIFSLFKSYFYKNHPLADKYTRLHGVTAENILENLPGHIFWKNKDGVCLGCNKNQYTDNGCVDKSSYIGKTDYDLYPKAQADHMTLVDREVIRTGNEQIAEEYGDSVFRKNTLYLSHKVPLKNKDGEILGILGVALDITHARQEEIDRKEFLENIIAMMPGHVFWADKNGVYLGCNDLQAKDIGLLSRKDIVGKRNKDLPWHTLITPEALDKLNREVMDNGVSQITEGSVRFADGTEKYFLSNKVPLRNEQGAVIGLLGIALDVTHLKKVEAELQIAKEKAEAADKLKTQFILNIQHDIRTPFNGIWGCSSILLENETDPEKRKFLQGITNSAKELLDYCNSILDLVQVEKNSASIIEKRFNLFDLVSRAIIMEKPIADTKNLTLQVIYQDGVPREFYGDDFRIYRILINLLSNACKFTKQGSVVVEVSLAKKENARKAIMNIIVKDTGEGISDDIQKVIFEKFTRGTLSNRGLYKGTGLGLYIVKHFIEELEGDLDLQSTIGQGSVFTCTIPLKLPLSN